MKRILLLVAAILAVAMLWSQSASAHVLITDATQTKGTILHISPDDDPIAGQPATLYFDMQATSGRVVLTVTNEAGETETVATQPKGTLATFTYTFPVQGVYQLTFKETVGATEYTFRQSQRVSRGVAASALDTTTHPWAELILIAGGIGIAILAIVAFNRRKTIARHSTF